MKEELRSKIYLGLILFLILVCGGLGYGIYYGIDHLNKPDKIHGFVVLGACGAGLILSIILITYLAYEYLKYLKTLPKKKEKKKEDKNQTKIENENM